MTTQYDVRLENYQIEWLQALGGASDMVRQALGAHMKRCRGQKTPRGYCRALAAMLPTNTHEIKTHYSIRVYLDQAEWLQDPKRNGSAEIRFALDAYIIWRDMGFKTIVRHKLKKKKRQSKMRHWTRLRPDQIEWMRSTGGNGSEILRTAISMYMSWCTSTPGVPEPYASVARGHTPGVPGTIGFEVRLDPVQYKWVNHTPQVPIALDIYMAWCWIAAPAK